MQDNSLFLGRLRAPIKMGMILFVGLTIALYAYLVGLRIFTEDSYGMFEMIRPEGKPLVQVMLASLAAALTFASLFLSDTKGAIEIKPEGFFDLVSVVLGRLAMIMTGFIVLLCWSCFTRSCRAMSFPSPPFGRTNFRFGSPALCSCLRGFMPCSNVATYVSISSMT